MLFTERLVLRPHTIGDLDHVLQLANDPAVHAFIRGLPTSREEAWHRLLRYAGHWSLLGYGMLAVFERSSGDFIGEVGLADFQRGLGPDFDGTPEAAWLFTGGSHGRGYAAEAMTVLLDWFEREYGPQRTVCIIDVANTASIKLADRLGFRPYGATVYREAAVDKYERTSS
ncbi:GNAT family N-acetyltransferase [Novosphingobium gossypii]|uniref:GNAT family N-acetyltransferase n=1 Tax=Novosphingobium gossypii TaxID=1604774 RepID=UPI003D21D42F